MRKEFRNTSRWLPRIVAVLMAIALTAAILHLSMDRGRLAMYPRVDDVIYMARGAELWRAGHEGWERGGAVGAVKGVARDWRKDPPHAPWASACAAIGFGVFGVKGWAAYVFTGLPVLAFGLAAGRIARRAGGKFGWRSGLLVVFAGSSPFLAASVQNLKPDYAAGIASAIGMMVLLRGPLLTARWQRLAWAGIWFGLALLAKPSMILATAMLCAGTLGACVLRDVVIAWQGMRNARSAWTIARSVRAGVIVAGIAALIALPHYWFALGNAWAYSRGILGGDEWAYQGTLADRLLFYLTGPAGRLMLDGRRTLIGLAIVIGWSAWMAWTSSRSGKSRRRLATIGAMLLVLGMAWAGPTLARVMISQFAAAFDALLWLVAVYAVSGMVRSVPRSSDGRGKRRVVAKLAGWAVVAALVATWRPTFAMMPPLQGEQAGPVRARAIERDRFLRDVYEAIHAAAEDAKRLGKRDIGVLLAGSPSDLGRPLATLWSIRDGSENMHWNVRELHRVPITVLDDPARTAEAIAVGIFEQNDVVVVNEPGTSLSRPKEVTAGADTFYLELARRHSGFVLVARLVDPASGRVVEVYRAKK